MTAKSWIYLFLLSLVWGTSFFFIEISLESFGPFTLVFLRVSIASLVLFSWMKLTTDYTLPKDVFSWMRYMLIGLVASVIPFVLISWGQLHITSSMASMLNASVPIFALVLAHFLTHDEKITPLKALGVAIGFSGIYILLSPSLTDGLSIAGLGQLSVVVASACYAFGGILGKQFSDTPPIINATSMLICASIILLPIMFIFETPLATLPSWESSVSVFALACLGSGIAYILLFKILASDGVVSVSLVSFMVPIHATILGALALNEDIALISLLGMGVIFIGLSIVDGRILKAIKR